MNFRLPRYTERWTAKKNRKNRIFVVPFAIRRSQSKRVRGRMRYVYLDKSIKMRWEFFVAYYIGETIFE